MVRNWLSAAVVLACLGWAPAKAATYTFYDDDIPSHIELTLTVLVPLSDNERQETIWDATGPFGPDFDGDGDPDATISYVTKSGFPEVEFQYPLVTHYDGYADFTGLAGPPGDGHFDVVGEILLGRDALVQLGSVTVSDVPSAAPAIPEPSTWVMLLLGFGGLGFLGYRQTRIAKSGGGVTA
jgi:hypothetical protein